MEKPSRAWILLPVAILVATVAGVLVSSYQKELGLSEPGVGGCAAVAAVASARGLSEGAGENDYMAFSRALLVAAVAYRNMPLLNPADTRLKHLLAQTLDCLTALREAWQAEIEQTWDPETDGSPLYWDALHPMVEIPDEGALSAGEVRSVCAEQATELLEKAVSLAD
jgi:hypothetical protein